MEPKKVFFRQGELRVPIGPKGSGIIIADERSRAPAGLLAERFKLATRVARARIFIGRKKAATIYRDYL